MSRDNVIGIVLIAAILIGSSILFSPSKEELAERQRLNDSIMGVRQEQQLAREAAMLELQQQQAAKAQLVPEGVAKIEELDSLQVTALRDQMGRFSKSAVGQEELIRVETDLFILNFNTKGGFLQSAQLKNYLTHNQDSLMLFFGDKDGFKFQFFSDNRNISTNNLFFVPTVDDPNLADISDILIEGSDSLALSLRTYTDLHTEENPSYIEFSYKMRGDEYMIDFDVSFVGTSKVIPTNTTFLNLDWNFSFPRQEKSRTPELNNTSIYYKYTAESPSKLSPAREKSENLNTRVKWVSFKQQFFNVSLIARESFESGRIEMKLAPETDERYIKHGTASLNLNYNPFADNRYQMNIFLGPNHFTTLKSYDLQLERLIPLGWGIFGWINRFVIIPVFNTLSKLNIGYGIIILILTILLKIVLLPLAYKSHMSQAKMKLLKPEIDEISKKFPDKEDALKKQQATMALYKKAGASPMSGCLPMLLQLPILIAMFNFFPTSIELRQQAFLWAEDLSSYDSIINLPFTIPMYGSHVSLFTLLMAITTVIYTRMNSQMMGSNNQMPGMKMMMYLMPVMMLVFFNSFASSLSYYYFLTNIITFGQTYLFKFFIDENKLHRQMEENKKKPVKKSKWSERMEQLQKQQQKVQAQRRKK